MKKIIIFVLSLYIFIVAVDIIRFGKADKPLITLKINQYQYNDGYVVQYISLGYEYIKSERNSDKGWHFNIGFSKLNSEFSNKPFSISYDGDYDKRCKNQKEYIYEDEKYIYYFACGEVEKLSARIDDKVYPIKEALENKMITINDVTASGYKILLDIKVSN